jgi:excisionase family DNA binding protein
MSEFMTAKQVAVRYGVHIKTVWDWIKKGKLEAFKFGGKAFRIKKCDLNKFEELYRAKPTDFNSEDHHGKPGTRNKCWALSRTN